MVSYYFLDTSALLKRYVIETGSTWVKKLTVPNSENRIIISEITLAEMSAVFSAKYRASGGITLEQRDAMLNTFLKHCATEYKLVATSRLIVDRAVVLTQNHKLRGCDAIQLATALLINDTLSKSLFPITFVASDKDLLQAAYDESLRIENPAMLFRPGGD
jgi:hypothetical protein